MAQSSLPCHSSPSDLHAFAAHQAFSGLRRVPIHRWNFGGKSLQKKRADPCFNGIGPNFSARSLYVDRQELYDETHACTNVSLSSNYQSSRSLISGALGCISLGTHAGAPISHSSQEHHLPVFFQQCFTQEKNRKPSVSGCVSGVTGHARFASDSRSSQQADLALSPEIQQKPLVASGWLYLGICGNSLITRVGSDSRCFHQPGFVCERANWREQTRTLCAAAVVEAPKSLLTELVGVESNAKFMPLGSVSVLKSRTTKNCTSEKLKKNSIPRQRKQRKTAILTRDLFGRSSFHLCEVIFCYPFMSSNSVVSNIQCLSRESLEELVGILRQIAVGLAGTGVALILFVASRMLSVNAAFDNHKMISMFFGLGLLSLSSATKRIADVVKCMADVCTKAKSPSKEHLVKLQKELQGFAFKAFPLIALCLVRFG